MGCRRRFAQRALLRLALAGDGRVVVSRTAPGRGAWLCPRSPVCLHEATKRGAVARALRARVDGGAVEAALAGALAGSADYLAEWKAAGPAPGNACMTTKG